ncbi:prolipoprotein diacylglyceryl transferase [Mycobacterium sp. SM1]|uniref:prolipoprotein diacylglyceryl transferase n=1 Tax=Mycobacterium sp. SM1 TaxID=2816243 RepID=UPI001BCE0B4B|nr:prolipoprotein diacylglyceryl transferase [Mycobacterium sp. SM1]MBS4729615.1 prolipoprotein diacylglyceryl transferase [Mycobacterium sp. SM1]
MSTVLAYFPSPPRGVWHLGPIPIRAYALCIIAGILVALVIGDRRWEDRGGERGVIYDIALWAVPFGLIGARLYHLITDWRTYFGSGGVGLGAALRIWDGGLGIWGAVALGGVGTWIACRRHGIPLPAFADAVAPGIVLAQAIGRLGNYFNQELYGRETTLPWGMEVFYRRGPDGYVDVHSLDGVSTGQVALVVQPTFLYELLWNVVVFVLLIYVDRRFAIGHGRLFALYAAGYCLGRFWIELLRADPATHIAGIRINSFTSTFVFIGAVVYFLLAPRGREDPATLRGARHAEEPAVPEPVAQVAAVAPAPDATAAVKGADRNDGEPAGGGAEAAQIQKAEPRPPEAGQPEGQAETAESKPAEVDAAEEVEPAPAQPAGPAEAPTEPAGPAGQKPAACGDDVRVAAGADPVAHEEPVAREEPEVPEEPVAPEDPEPREEPVTDSGPAPAPTEAARPVDATEVGATAAGARWRPGRRLSWRRR